MSPMGHSRLFRLVERVSALPPIATRKRACPDVRNVPKADIDWALGTRPTRVVTSQRCGWETLTNLMSLSDGNMRKAVEHPGVADHLVLCIKPNACVLNQLVLITAHHEERRLPFRACPEQREV